MTLHSFCAGHCLVADWLAAGLLPLTQRSPTPTLYRIGHFLELKTSRSRNRTILSTPGASDDARLATDAVVLKCTAGKI
jgi:hypothetical protein